MRLCSVVFAALMFGVPFSGALAEPQILGLMAQNEPVPLKCVGGECYAEVSSFCMEPMRASPRHASVYHPFDDARVTLIAKHADGTESRLFAGEVARFVSQRGYAAVRISVPEAKLAEIGASSAAIEVGRRVALMPEWNKYSRRAHEPEEIALARGPNRETGERLVDNGGARAETARVLSYLINALPEKGVADQPTKEGLWQQVAARHDLSAFGRGAVSEAKDAVGYCLGRDPAETGFTMRQCLERSHDLQIWHLNSVYWAAVGRSS